MPFDREAALAAGYSEQEIEAYLATRGDEPTSPGAVASRIPMAAPAQAAPGEFRKGLPITSYRGAPDFETTPVEGAPWWADPVDAAAFLAGPTMGIGRAVMRPAMGLAEAGIRAVGPVAKAVGRAPVALGRALGRRALGKGNFDDALREVLGTARSRTPKAPAVEAAPPAAPAPAPAPAPVAQPPAAAASRPAPRPRKPVRPKAKPKAAAKPKGSAESRSMTAEQQAAAREKGRAQVTGSGRDLRRLGPSGQKGPGKSQAMRGASGAELERRAAARAATRAEAVPAEGDDLAGALEQSLLVMRDPRFQALSPQDKNELFRLLRQVAP